MNDLIERLRRQPTVSQYANAGALFAVLIAEREEAAAALEAAREDGERLVFLASERVPEGFVGDKDDIYDYACDCAEENGRDEPNDADLIEGYRRMIDSARAIDQARGKGVRS